ncbi:MAG: coenzyme F420-0:L-glutamate ligase [Candidatus Levyibacteriota bacterium]
MNIVAIKTHTITPKDTDIFAVLDAYIKELPEKSVIAVTSKIVSITEGRVVKIGDKDKDELIAEESQYFLPRNKSKYQVSFTIAHNMLVPTAGIDESNGNGYFVLWPKNPQASVNAIREHLVQRFGVKEVGVIITDSKTTPLRWGVTGMAIAHSGFHPLKNYIGEKDLFGRPFVFEQLNIADSLATSAVFSMGEGAEQTPLALITDVPHIAFQENNPTPEELASMAIDAKEDLYEPLLTSVQWKKGKKS